MSIKTSFHEGQLLIDCLKRDRRAQKELYDKYKDAMFTIALRITNNRDDASDSLQDAFIQVFRDLGQFRSESTLGAWIKTIVIRTAIKKKKMVFVTESLDAINANDIIHWPEELNGHYLDIAIKELPEGYRVVFLLTEVEGYTHKEVAGMLGISASTSKSQLFRAKKMLQNKLQHLI